MKVTALILFVMALTSFGYDSFAQTSSSTRNLPAKNLYIDVHQLQPGKVKFADVANAHAKDLAVQKKYGVDFIKFWVDEEKGLVYCVSSSSDSAAIRKTHAEAHGLLPDHIYTVTGGIEAALKGGRALYLDIHELGQGTVTARDVAGAHQKDLDIQHKHGVNFINYWLDEKAGTVICLSEAKDSISVVNTHKEAHGLVPAKVMKVKQGQ
ncbi:MAG TPA: DUF4242 domain-containing protein [Flavitalea sp.]|nr:DUF4242 domain-containing protein [Flavitalea sp.]